MPGKFLGYEEGYLPFAPAAGAINGLSEEEITTKILDVSRSPAAAVKYGSFTYHGGNGNDGRTYYHNAVTGMTVNAMGLPNIGASKAAELHKKLQPRVEVAGKPLIPSISPGKGENPMDVLPAMTYMFANAGAKIVEVNYSCPNKPVDGGSKFEPVLGYDLGTVFEIDERIVEEIGPDITIIRKLPPFVGSKRAIFPEALAGFSAIEGRAKVKGKVVLGIFNTIGSQQILDEMGDPALSIGETKDNLGGVSGKAFAEMAVDGLRKTKKFIPKTVGTISSIGVDSGQEIYRRVNVEGADLAEGVTVLWENERRGLSFGQTISNMAEEYYRIHEDQG